MWVFLVLLVLAFLSGRFVAYMADDEVDDSKKYIRESLYLFQAYIIYFITLDLFFMFSSYFLFRLLKDKAFHPGILLAIYLSTKGVLPLIMAVLFSYMLGLFEYKKGYWKHYLMLFLIKVLILFVIIPKF